MVTMGSGKVRIRRRIALLLEAISDDYQAAIVRGAASAAQHAKLDLVCIAGGVVCHPRDDPRGERNFVFDLVDPAAFDGILLVGGALGHRLGTAGLSEWTQRFAGLPMVSLGVELARCHNVLVDGVPGLADTLTHLITVHQRRRIAFVRGPAGSFEAEERFAAYRKVLAAHGIREDSRLVVQGDWLRESGERAIAELFDRRGLRPDEVTAIASANDYMALGAMDALRQRGLSVPHDVALVGFDDVDPGRCAVPPLTTVQQPTEAMGREGIRRLLSLMGGSTEALATKLPATIVRRRSCGCGKGTTSTPRRRRVASGRALDMALIERRDLIFAELSRSARGELVGVGSRWEQRLLSALIGDLQTAGSGGAFLTFVDQMMASLQCAGAELAQVQPILATLRRNLQECAGNDADAAAHVDDLLDSAGELVAEWLVRGEMLRRLEAIDLLRRVSQIAPLLLRAPWGHAERKSLEEALRRLGIGALSLGAFTELGQVTPACLSLAGFEPSGQARAVTQFRSSDFGPAGIFDAEQRALLVQPLVQDDQPLGILTLPLGNHHGSVYEQLRETLGFGLRGYHLAARGG